MTAYRPVGYYHSHIDRLSRYGHPDIQAPPHQTVAARFPGDPGAGRMLLGANNASGTRNADGTPTSTDPGQGDTIDWLDGFTYGLTAGVPKAHLSLVREYNQGGIVPASGDQTHMTGWGTQGRVTLYSLKPGSWTYTQIGNGSADADIDAAAYYFHSQPTLFFWVTIRHEADIPTNVVPGDEVNYRAGYNRIIDRFAAAGVTNVAWVAGLWTNTPWSANPQGRDYRLTHPDWTGSAWKTSPRVPLLGRDIYNPQQNPPSTGTTKSWEHFAQPFLSNMASTGCPTPNWCVGEGGFYGLTGFDSGGVTVDQMLTDMINIGAGQEGMVGYAAWQSGNARFTTGFDPAGVRSAAWIKAAANPNVVRV